MHDMFGQDAGNISESATATPPAPAATPAAPAPAAATAPATAAAATPAAAPTLQQAVDKAVAKTEADKAVQADPNAMHHVKLAPFAPTVLGSTATGAAIGFGLGGPPGAAVGAGLGWLAERYQIAGGPFGVAASKVKALFTKTPPPAAPPAASAPPAAKA
jgi:pyruvate dehydrogenase E2 component (dihydrolipoamide acetyltransferase)